MIDLTSMSDADKRALIGVCPACCYEHSVIGDPAMPGHSCLGACARCSDRGFVLLPIGPKRKETT